MTSPWELVGASLALACFVQAGLLTTVAIAPESETSHPSPGEWLSRWFATGVVVLCVQLVTFTELSVGYSVWTVLAPWAMGWVGLAAWPEGRRRMRGQLGGLTRGVRAASRAAWTLTACVAVLAAFMLARSLVVPVSTWDGWAIWDLKARAFFLQRSLLPLLHQPSYGLAHLHYPPLVPLAGTTMYLFTGHPTTLVQIVGACFYLAALAQAHAAFRRLGSPPFLAALFTGGMALLPNVLFWSQHYQAEAPLLFYSLALTCWIAEWLRHERRAALHTAALFGAGLALTKVEGLLLCLPAVAAVMAVALLRRHARTASWLQAASFVGLIAVLYLPWALFPKLNLSGPSTMTLATLQTVFEGRHLVAGQLRGVATWSGTSSYLGAFALMFPLLLAVGSLRVRPLLRRDMLFVLFQTCYSALPYLVFFLGAPNWFSVPALGRYLIVFTGLSCFSLAMAVILATNGWRLPSRAAWLGVPAAVIVASAIVAVPLLVRDLGEPVFAWRFDNAQTADWRAGFHTSVTARDGELVVEPTGEDAGFESRAGLNLSTSANKQLRLLLRQAAADDEPTLVHLELFWRDAAGVFRQDQAESQSVMLSGRASEVVFSPPWQGLETVDQLRIDIDAERFRKPPTLAIREIRTNSRLQGLLLGVADRPLKSPGLFVGALALVLLLVIRREAMPHLVLALAYSWFWLIGLYWVSPDVFDTLRLSPGGYIGPASLVRGATVDIQAMLAVPAEERPGWLDANDGAREFTQVVASIARDCPGAEQVWFYSRPENSHVTSTFARQRSGYLLFPRDIDIITDSQEFADKLARPARPRAVVFYARRDDAFDLPGRVVFMQGADYRVLCQA